MSSISIVDIAKKAGVSIATVSRILNNKGGYSIKTRDKVLDIVLHYNFKLNSNAKSLKINKTFTIGVVVPDITNEFFASLIREIWTFFSRHSYSIFICDSNENISSEKRYLRDLKGQCVDGIIYIQGQDSQGIDTPMNIPVVYIDRESMNGNSIFVSDNYQGGVQVGEYIRKRNRKNILIIKDKHNFSSVNQRVSGLKEILEREKINYTTMYVKNPNIENGYELIKENYSKLLPDAVFSTNDYLAMGVYKYLKENNIVVKKDVDVIGFDGIYTVQHCITDIVSVKQNNIILAKRASEELYRLMTGKNDGIGKMVIPVSLINDEE